MKTAEEFFTSKGVDIGDIVCYSTKDGTGRATDFDPIAMAEEYASQKPMPSDEEIEKPSILGEKVVYDDNGIFIWAIDKKGGHQKIADLRGWGAIQNMFNKDGIIDTVLAEAYQDNLGEYIVKSINTYQPKEIDCNCPLCNSEMFSVKLTHYKCKKCNEYFTN